MAKLTVEVALTLSLGEREFYRPVARIEEIDTSLPIEPQLEACRLALPQVFDTVTALLSQKSQEFLKGT